MTPTELMQNAHSVESQGIPVDWKELCMKVFNSANEAINKLEESVAAVRVELEELKDGTGTD